MGKRKNLNSSFGSASDLDDDDVYFGLEDDGVSLWLSKFENKSNRNDRCFEETLEGAKRIGTRQVWHASLPWSRWNPSWPVHLVCNDKRSWSKPLRRRCFQAQDHNPRGLSQNTTKGWIHHPAIPSKHFLQWWHMPRYPRPVLGWMPYDLKGFVISCFINDWCQPRWPTVPGHRWII